VSGLLLAHTGQAALKLTQGDYVKGKSCIARLLNARPSID
jgi:hypothetical protein